MKRGMGGHHSHEMGKDEWLTPPRLLEELGPFDLDPCAPATRPWDMAARHITAAEDGLAQPWSGFVWCNPPYGSQTGAWLSKLARHGHGLALIFARTETEDFRAQVWGKADAILFLHRRLHFHHADGSRAAHNSGAPSVLVAYGPEGVARLRACNLSGAFVTNWCCGGGS